MDAVHFQLLFVCLCVFQSLHSFHNNNNIHFHSTNLPAPSVNDDRSCRQGPVGHTSCDPTPNTSLPPTSPSSELHGIRSPIEQSEIHTHSHSLFVILRSLCQCSIRFIAFLSHKQTTQSNVNNKPLEAVQCVVASPLALLQHDPIQARHNRWRPTKGMFLCLSARSCAPIRTACR